MPIRGKKSYSQSIVTGYTDRIICGCVAACLLAAAGPFSSSLYQAQTVSNPSPRPTPPTQQSEPIKIYTEEVLLPVVATDSSGRFDPTLEADDLLILKMASPKQSGAFAEFRPAFCYYWTLAVSETRQ